MVRVVVYRVTGWQGWLPVPQWLCPECDLTVAAVEAAVRLAGVGDVPVEVRPWLCWLRAALRVGAWHPPAVVVDGVLLSQGRVPDVQTLSAQLAAHAAEGKGTFTEVPRSTTDDTGRNGTGG